MDNSIVKEGMDILNKLSPKNQTDFMVLLRLAEAAENGAKREMSNQSRKPSKNAN